VAFQFKQASCVATGTFNVYVVQPGFLRAIEVFRAEPMVKFEANLTQPGFRFTVLDDHATWVVRPDRIAIESENRDKDCGQDMAQTLGALRWTPLTAIGCNVVYSGLMTEDLRRLFVRTGDAQGFEFLGMNTHVAIKRDNAVFNVQVGYSEGDGCEISINAHEDLTRLGSQVEISERAVEVARRYFEIRRTSSGLAEALFGVELPQ
jgi:hypothetical protein